ncbi:MAG: MT-A70 family methyltransferase [Chloroflexota bacterium]
MTGITHRDKSLTILGDKFRLYPNSLVVDGEPSKEEYVLAFNRLQFIEGSIHWWYGDLCRAYEGQYGAIAGIADNSGFDTSTIYDDKWVATKYEVSDRSETLSWKHHRIAAPYEDRLEWLKQAEENNWSARDLQLAITKTKRREPPLPEGVYNVIYADPPWEYSNALRQWGPAESHYPTMSIDELCDLAIPAAENAVLFLWVTNPFLRDAFQVIDAWGFQYKTNIVWLKSALKKPGSGFWVRGRHELLFICSKGSFVPDQTGRDPVGSVIEDPIVLNDPVTEHSTKPERVYEIIEYLYPNANYLELFARNTRPNWTAWGLEAGNNARRGDTNN